MKSKWYRTSKPTVIYGDRSLVGPAVLHDAPCRYETERCTCRSAVARLPIDTVVQVIDENPISALVEAEGKAPCWVERQALEVVKAPKERPRRRTIPEDYLELLQRMGAGKPFGKGRKRPQGGQIVFVRGDEDREPWRYVGHVSPDGIPHVLLVDPTVPTDRVLDVARGQVRLVQICGQQIENLLVVA